MATASASEKGWEIAEKGRPAPSLLVQLRQRFYVLPWNLVLFAEGSEAQVRITFHTHIVAVQGSGLGALLLDLAAHSVTQLVEPDRTAKFTPGSGPQITAVSVTENK